MSVDSRWPKSEKCDTCDGDVSLHELWMWGECDACHTVYIESLDSDYVSDEFEPYDPYMAGE